MINTLKVVGDLERIRLKCLKGLTSYVKKKGAITLNKTVYGWENMPLEFRIDSVYYKDGSTFLKSSEREIDINADNFAIETLLQIHSALF